MEVNHRCIHCGQRIMKLLVQYSPGNIRLMKCDNCKLVADPYVECELMILLIDLILHKEKSYRHLLYNVLPGDLTSYQGLFWKSVLIYLVFDGCILTFDIMFLLFSSSFHHSVSFFLSGIKVNWDLPSSSLLIFQICTKVLMTVLVANCLSFGLLFYVLRILLRASLDGNRCKEIFLATILSSYFRIFIVTMMVWEYPPGIIYIVDALVLSSNAVALKVLTQLSTTCCIGACLAASITKFFIYSIALGLPS